MQIFACKTDLKMSLNRFDNKLHKVDFYKYKMDISVNSISGMW